jgi:uncharacterized damage-inducible protein DinB
MEVLFRQYALVVERRETLFSYCESLQPKHFTENLDSFGGRSICYLMVHTASTYHFWLGHFAALNNSKFLKEDQYTNVKEVQTLYDGVYDLTDLFLKQTSTDIEKPIVNKIPGRDFELSLTPLQLFTHLITHEYHHKGQVLSMSRQLGYIPIDTDIIRFD